MVGNYSNPQSYTDCMIFLKGSQPLSEIGTVHLTEGVTVSSRPGATCIYSFYISTEIKATR